MDRHSNSPSLAACCLIPFIAILGCSKKSDPADGLPPSAQIVQTGNLDLVTVDKPEQFPVVAAERIEAANELQVTGSVNPDIAREVPVISLASGRVVDIKARLDDHVSKGQLLLKVQSPDITNAFDAYLKAVNDEQLASKAYVRAKDLYQHGAIPLSGLEQAEDSEKDIQADLTAADEQLKTLGIDKNHPGPVVSVYAPISGVIVAQNVTNAAAAGMTFSGSATAFTIADLSTVWIICDVYENDIPKLQLGQSADIRINAYPDKVLVGHISDIGPVLDPTIRTAKVRLEVPNPGLLKLGMFATATFSSKTKEAHAVVPTSAVLHMHDRDFVFIPAGEKTFKRVEVRAGDVIAGDRQVVLSGLDAGQKVVTNVLLLDAMSEAK
jgi:cobalt-zinc-cadmium efflux system membrane fusion protein